MVRWLRRFVRLLWVLRRFLALFFVRHLDPPLLGMLSWFHIRAKIPLISPAGVPLRQHWPEFAMTPKVAFFEAVNLRLRRQV